MVARNKTFDCVQMKHEIQERIARETEGMTTAQFMEYMQRGAEEFRRTHKPSGQAGGFKALFDAIKKGQEKRGNP